MHNLIKKAAYFAAEKHNGQYRKGTKVPYFAHPTEVAILVAKYTADTNTICAALLHDTIEDCEGVTFELLSETFNPSVAAIVLEVSKDKKHATWKETKEAYIAAIRQASEPALIVAAADKMTNMESYFSSLVGNPEQTAALFKGSPEEYIWYYKNILDILMQRLPAHKVTEDYLKLFNSIKEKVQILL